MTNDSDCYTYGGESEKTHKSPSDFSLNIIKQFARVYSTTHGIDFSYCILN